MPNKKLLGILMLFVAIASFSQTNFTYTPEHPKAGDLITFTYEPSGVLAGNLKFVDAVYYNRGGQSSADDIVLKRIGKKFTGTVQTDTANSFVYFGFSIDNQYDNNFNNGYYVVLNGNENKPKQGAYQQLASFYQYNTVGVDRDVTKALNAIQKEIDANPGNRNQYLPSYISLLFGVKKEEAQSMAEKEIEAILKKGLAKEDDYQLVADIYRSIKLPEQGKVIISLQKEKFPDGKWRISDFMSKLNQETDADKASVMIKQLENNINTNPDWKLYEANLPYYKLIPQRILLTNKKYDDLQKAMPGDMSVAVASFYNSIGWQLQKANERLDFAAEVSGKGVMYARNEMNNPVSKKPATITTKQWAENRKYTYTQFADTYGMVLYRMGKYKEGFALMQDVLKLDNRNSPDYNNTYALLAEKVLSKKKYKKEMEDFIKSGKSTSEMADNLKAAYVKDKGSDTGFDEYIAALKKESYLKMLEDVRKTMLNQAAPAFALLDLNGSKININDLKGKTVIVDFWATWCGPCKASFPAMQKMVEKYKDNPDVKFVFIDTWEQVQDKKKNAADFVSNNKYGFNVLVDDEDKVVAQFKVDGIPTKFVIDRSGNIRFKAVGFDGSDDRLVSELTAMIDLASEPPKKTL